MNTMNTTKRQRANSGDPLWDLVVEVDCSAARLSTLISALQLMMERFGLDALELTEYQKQDLVNRHSMIADTLNLVIDVIQTETENLDKLTTAACEAG